MARPGGVALTLGLLLLIVGGGMGASASPAPGLFAIGDQFDRVQFRITIAGNASAEWTFHYERVLENDSATDNYRTFADRFNTEETDLFADFKTQARALAEDGRDVTGRNMSATAFSKRAYVDTGLDNDIGVVEMSFRWTAFAQRRGETLVVADIFEGGLYIDSGQSLVFMTESGLQFRTVDPKESAILSGERLDASDSVTWQGEMSFSDEHPRVVVGPTTPTPTPTPDSRSAASTSSPTVTDPPTTTPATASTPMNASGASSSDSSGWTPLIGIFLVIVFGSIGLWRYTDVFGGDGTPPAPGSDTRPDDGSAGASASGATNDGDGANSTEPAVSDAELLSDEDRIKDLIHDHGGRMRQSQIVESTGWSKSKVSMLLSEMDDEDMINKLRIGRENIITLPGHEPEAMQSPYEEVGSDTSTGE